MYALNLALDVRTGDFLKLLHDLDGLRVWGPLHTVLVALIQLVAGPDHRLAVLPSLAGWVLTIWCAFMIPRRLLAQGGNAAGLLAAFLVATSPAHRAFATDVMYESLGAGLSLAAIYLYLVAVQEPTRRAGMLLGITLTALFLHKYNYWLLIAFGLTGAEFARQPLAWWGFAWSLCTRDRLPAWALTEIKHPLNWLAAALAACAAAVVITGGGTFPLGPWRVSVQEPHNLVHFAYVAFFIRMVLWWRQTGRDWSLTLAPALRGVMLWQVGGIALWFLMPKRLSYFLWYVSPSNSDGLAETSGFLHGIPYYVRGLQADYLPVSFGIYLFGASLLLGLFALGKLKRGSFALVAFFLIAAFLTCQHPMLKNRHMHSWVAAGWVLGAIGVVFSIRSLAGFLSERASAWSGTVVCGILIALHAPALLTPAHAQEGGLKPELPLPVTITEHYLPALADARQPTILSNVSARFLWTWTFIERHGHQNVTVDIKNLKIYESDIELPKRWLTTTRSDALVLIDIRPGSSFHWQTGENVDLKNFHQALSEQNTWSLNQRWVMPDGVTISLWNRSSAAAQR
jgi:hypothetical protein